MKYYIIPNTEIAMTVEADSRDEAMSDFAWRMNSDMNEYFRAVTEDEYIRKTMNDRFEASHQQFIDFAIDLIMDEDNEYDDDVTSEIAESAWDIHVEGKFDYTDYDCVQAAIEEYERRR